MKRHEIIETILTDAAKGEIHPLLGLLDWLVYDCNCDLGRLLLIAQRRFGIPVRTSILTIGELV
jgi:hypothetical protein